MAYKTVPAKREGQKLFHLILHFIALLAGVLGIYAVFKFHNELFIPNMYTLHSWLGMSTICLFGLQVINSSILLNCILFIFNPNKIFSSP